MPRTTAGRRYPFASTTARVHDHRFCLVISQVIGRALAGAEAWGTPHPMPPIGDELTAHRVRNRLFAAKQCGRLADEHGAAHSVSVMYARPDGTLTNARAAGPDGYVLVVRVWPLDTGRRAIVNRVASGTPLAYNPMRG